MKKDWNLNIPHEGLESIQYSKPWSWSIGGWLISSTFGASITTKTLTKPLFFLLTQMGYQEMNQRWQIDEQGRIKIETLVNQWDEKDR